MKGFTNIKLYDKHGNIVKDQDDNNMITNLLNDFLKAILSTKQNKILGKEDNIINQFKNMKLIDFIGGIVLYPDTIPENAEIQGGYIESVASAGSRYDYADPLRGSLNELESGETTVDGKKAYRYVWDFGTSNGNCTFTTVGLTTKIAGDRIRTTNNIQAFYSVENADYAGMLPDSKVDGHYTRQVNSNGIVNICRDNKLKTIKPAKSKKITDTGKLSFEKATEFSNRILSDCCFQEADMLHLLAFNTSLNKYELLKVNSDTHELISFEDLPELATKYGTKRIAKFGYLDDDNMVLDIRVNSSQLSFEVYTRSTGTIETKNISIGDLYPRKYWEPIFYKTGNNKYAMTIAISAVYPGNYGDSYNSGVVHVWDKDNYKFTKGGERLAGPYGKVGNGGIAIWADGHVGSFYNQMLFFSADEPLFTINNLERPITKTEANTMKISYTLVL